MKAVGERRHHGTDVTNAQNNKTSEASTLAREKGWVKPDIYDYQKYNAGPSLEKPSDEDGQEEPVPEWAAKAAKYELTSGRRRKLSRKQTRDRWPQATLPTSSLISCG
jgi:hypothetical protein